ncbi:MAG: hypothetical protein DRP11_00080 [Candidatus Aenigmatarchaeota archaeon]|nr:MAG: hypothetical protein DRP11_00080 [Candidatus Aenigmarchaeota archaeon]
MELKKKGGKVARIARKAKEIRKKGESWKSAIKRAAKMLAEEEGETAEEEKKEEPQEKVEEASEKKEVVQEMQETNPGLALPVDGAQVADEQVSEEDRLLKMDEAVFKILKEGGL